MAEKNAKWKVWFWRVMNDVIEMHMPYLCEKIKVNIKCNCLKNIER